MPVYYYPPASDACCSNVNVGCSPASGSVFTPGTTTTVTTLATDGCLNSNICTFTVTVICNTNECPCAGTNGPVILNGCFDTGDLTDWTVSGNLNSVSVLAKTLDDGLNAPAPYFVDLGRSGQAGNNTGAYLQQTVSGFTPGQAVRLSFWYSVEYDSGPSRIASTPALEVDVFDPAIDGNPNPTVANTLLTRDYDQLYFEGNGSTTPATWTKVALNFRPATTDPLVFRFTDLSSTGVDPQIDCVCLRAGNGVETNTCTNGCITIYNPNDIVVYACTNVPVYYYPTASDACCSNVNVGCNPASGSLFVPGTSTTVTTLATDGCLNSNTCTFTVTVVNDCTNCLSVQCPTNKTVSCDTNWAFDLPVVLSSCCGTNYSININGSDVTSNAGPCSINVTRSWVITDCTGLGYFCSQTMTVAPPTSYTLTLQPGDNFIANQLNHVGGNGANLLFTNIGGSRDFDALQFYGCTNDTLDYFDSGSPSGFDDSNFNPLPSAPTLSPGQGVDYVNNSGIPETVTFTGTPVCPPLPATLCPCGTVSLVSYELDCPGTYQDITGLQPQPGVEVLRWNGSGYNTYTYVHTGSGYAWSPSVPVLNVGEAAFILIPCPTNCLSLQCPGSIETSTCMNCALVGYAATATDTCCSNVAISYYLGTVEIGTNYCFPVGQSTVTVQAEDGCSNTASCSFTVTVAAGTNCCATTNEVVLNTGYNQNADTVYGIGQADAYWWVTANPPGTGTVPRPATAVSPNPAWKPALADSQWLSSYGTDMDNTNGEYDFETTFCLEPGATNLALNVCLRVDDAASVALNGHVFLYSPPLYSFALAPTCGTAVNPAWFVTGPNVVHVSVTNIDGVAMGLNLTGTVTGTGLIMQTAPCCHTNSGISGLKFLDLNGNGVQERQRSAAGGVDDPA